MIDSRMLSAIALIALIAFCTSSLQLFVSILFVIIGSLNINRRKDQTAAIVLNDVILVVIFVISVINVIISGFSIEHAVLPPQAFWRETTSAVSEGPN